MEFVVNTACAVVCVGGAVVGRARGHHETATMAGCRAVRYCSGRRLALRAHGCPGGLGTVPEAGFVSPVRQGGDLPSPTGLLIAGERHVLSKSNKFIGPLPDIPPRVVRPEAGRTQPLQLAFPFKKPS